MRKKSLFLILSLLVVLYSVESIAATLVPTVNVDTPTNLDVTWFWDDTNLHRVWDSQMIDHMQYSYTEYAQQIQLGLTDDEKAKLLDPTLLAFVHDSRSVHPQVYELKRGCGCPGQIRQVADGERYIFCWWSRTITRLGGVKVRVEGMENLVPGQTYIFAANHQSQFDIFALDGFLMVDFRWLAKKELARIPIVGAAIGLAGSVFVDRSHGREAMKSLAEAATRIASGTSVVVFPEGTRTPDGNLQPFKSGAMYLAIKSGVDIVPLAITGGYEVLPKGRFFFRPGQMVVKIGKPVSTKHYSQKQKQELADLLHDQVASLIAV